MILVLVSEHASPICDAHILKNIYFQVINVDLLVSFNTLLRTNSQYVFIDY